MPGTSLEVRGVGALCSSGDRCCCTRLLTTVRLGSSPDTIEGQLTPLYAQLVPLARKRARQAAQDPQTAPNPEACPQNACDPVFRGRSLKPKQMAGREGRRSNPDFVWKRISELHARRYS